MIPLRNKTRQYITIAFITLICVAQVALPLHRAMAIPVAIVAPLPVPVIVVTDEEEILDVAENTITAGATTEIAGTSGTSAIQNTLTAANTTASLAKQIEDFATKYVVAPAMRVALITLIQTMSNEVVGWIKGDGGKNGGFVKNLQQNLYTEANLQAGEFLNHVSGINLCSINISKLIKLQIKTPGFEHLNAQLACSLTGIVDNVDRFYKDFNQGGWPAFVGIAVDSRNNAIGASMIAEVNFAAQKGSAAEALQNRLNRGTGFKGVTLKKKSQVCDTSPNPEPGEEPYCHTQEEDTTPGAVVADALKENLNHVGIALGAAEVSAITNEADAAVNAIITALIQRVFKEATNLF